MTLTVDASVFVSAARPGEVNHIASFDFVSRVDSEGVRLVCPTLALAESAAAIARITGDLRAANDLVIEIESLPGIELIPLSTERARKAAAIAINQRLRGADAIYAQVAVEEVSLLVTWDSEMLSRASAIVASITPTDWINANPAPAV